MDHFGIPSLEAQDALVKRRSNLAASFMDEGHATSAAAVVADDDDADDDDWDLENAVGLE